MMKEGRGGSVAADHTRSTNSIQRETDVTETLPARQALIRRIVIRHDVTPRRAREIVRLAGLGGAA